ncbi:MAG: hypothetical protein JRJ24_09890 [Deltaproteobacteria bacterium]|nr:hypothetical protein [Deltaproteobacteria bacterium]
MALVELSTAAPHIRLLTLNEPETRNAISFDLTAELYRALDALQPNCEGLPMSRIAIRSMQYISGLIPAMRGIPQPIIGAINGAAYGGGLCLSLGADIRLAGELARRTRAKSS